MNSHIKMRIIVLLIIMLLPSVNLINCQKDFAVDADQINNENTLINDIYEPNNSRSQAYKIKSLPCQISQAVLIDKMDLDWFMFSLNDIEEDTCEIKITFEMNDMNDEMGIEGFLYNEPDSLGRYFQLYKGADSDAKVIFGWKCIPDNYFLLVRLDTLYSKEGKYSFTISTQKI